MMDSSIPRGTSGSLQWRAPPQRLRIVFYFAKWPEPGTVKTRLASEVGDDLAAVIYQIMAEDQFEILREGMRSGVYTLWIYGAPVHLLGRLTFWLNGTGSPIVDAIAQPDRPLGGRLDHAMNLGFGELKADEVYFVCSDCPEIAAEDITRAACILQNRDVVFGRATDGGFYLMGMSRIIDDAFDEIEYFRPDTLERLAARLQDGGATVDAATLPPKRDVDTLRDWNSMPRDVQERLQRRAALRNISFELFGNH